jgi:Phosphodiester glycosidase/FlgD Ig-like domain
MWNKPSGSAFLGRRATRSKVSLAKPVDSVRYTFVTVSRRDRLKPVPVELERVLRRALVALLVLAAPASAAPQELLPGLTYERKIEFTTTGPVVVNVLTMPQPGGPWQLRPVLSNEAIPRTETLTSIQRRLSTTATVAGVNGDLFGISGAPSGILMRNGALDQPPLPRRSTIGIDADGKLKIGRVAMFATWQGSGPRRALADMNAAPSRNSVSLYTPAWGRATPAAPGTVQVAIAPLPPATPNVELTAPVVAVSGNGAAMAIPPTGTVLVARGTAGIRLQAEAAVGSTVKIRLILRPWWPGVANALGGGPVLVRDGRPVFRANEQFSADQLLARSARTAVGQLPDRRIVLVTVDGGQPGYSVGVTNFELALELVKLGAVTAAALDSAGSSEMAFEGKLLSRRVGPEKPIGDALIASYTGVYVPAPLEPVLSPNGDGIAETQHLSYKVVRPSTVTAALVGPDGVARRRFSGPVQPGTFSLDWNGLEAEGAPEEEGRWRWEVTATDTSGESSSAVRTFDLNQTLSSPEPVAPPLAVPRREARSVAAFTLTRPATVVPRIETTSGVVLRSLPRRRAGAGDLEVAWDGLTDTGATAPSGRYVAEVTATNDLGPVTLSATFEVRRLPPPPPPKPKPKPRPRAKAKK